MPLIPRRDWISDTNDLPEDLGRRTVRGGIWAIGGQGLLALLQLLTTVVLARLLLPEDFGLFAMAAAVSGFFTLFAELGLSQATVQRKVLTENILNALFYVNLLAGLVVMAVMMLSAPLVAAIFGDARLTAIVIVSSAAPLIMAASRQHAALLQRHMEWRSIQSIAVGAQLVAASLAVGLAFWTDWGYWALVAQNVTVAAFMTASTWYVCSWRPSRVTDWREAKEPLKYGFHLSLFGLLNMFHRQSDDVLIGWRWGAAELGQYNRAYTLLKAPLQLINTPIGSAIVPALSRLQDEPGRWRNMYLDTLAFVTLISGLVGATLYACSETVVAILFGPGWELAGQILGFLSLAMIPAGAANTCGWIYQSLGTTSDMARWALFSTPIYLLAFLFSLEYGSVGLAIAYAGVTTVLLIPCFWFAVRKSPASLKDVLQASLPLITISFITAYLAKLPSLSFLNPGFELIERPLVVFVVLSGLLLVYSIFDNFIIRRLWSAAKAYSPISIRLNRTERL